MKKARFLRIINVINLLGLIFSIIFIPPMLISLYYGEGLSNIFGDIFLFTVFITAGLLWVYRKNKPRLHKKDAFLIAIFFWVFSSLLASIPFDLVLHTSVVDSLFEAVSGMTTTGATVLSGLDVMPKSLLFYRQELQWFGGMGLIVLAVAILPQLGVGGMSIYKAEAPGPMKEEKLTPKIQNTASIFWKIYLGVTLLCAFSYWLAGMTAYDAVAHSLSTVSTGGFSTHDASLNYFHSVLIENIATVFMLFGAINFSIHFFMLKRRSLMQYADNEETRIFLFIILFFTAVITTVLVYEHSYSAESALQNTWFTVVSVITSTGFVTADFSKWPLFLPVLLMLIGFIGGTGGSTAGGLKVMRVYILVKLVYREVRLLLHPKAYMVIRLNKQSAIPNQTLQSIFSFLFLYLLSFVVLLLLMLADGVDYVSAFSAIATSMNNMGPALGTLSQSFASLDDFAKIISILSMLLGRLEIVPFLIILLPEYWQ